MPARVVLRFANHLLAGEDWARARLAPFAGRALRVEFGPAVIPMRIDETGLLAPADESAVPDVSLRLPVDAPIRALSDPAALLSSARISGTADFAEALSFVFRNLRWDIEQELANHIGDIAARRLTLGGRAFFTWHQRAASNLFRNIAECFSVENPPITQRQRLVQFTQDIAETGQAVDQLDRRIRTIEARR